MPIVTCNCCSSTRHAGVIRKTAVLKGWFSGSIHLLPATVSFFYAACYEQIYNDLNQAITYYQASGIARKEDENHKINVNAAYATYARAALTREDWSTAAHYAALARAGYPLMNADEYFDGFSTVNREWIWSIYDSEEESLGNSSSPHALHTTPPLLLYALIRPVSTVNCTMHYRKVISAGDFFSIRSNILITRVV